MSLTVIVILVDNRPCHSAKASALTLYFLIYSHDHIAFHYLQLETLRERLFWL